jgi:hypothetical protein
MIFLVLVYLDLAPQRGEKEAVGAKDRTLNLRGLALKSIVGGLSPQNHLPW